MKFFLYQFLTLLFFALLHSQSHTSQNSLDWNGMYVGMLPCADCDGIETTLELHQDKTYILTQIYHGKSDSLFTQKNSFEWSRNGRTIILEGIKNAPSQYQVGEKTLTQLDMNGNVISGKLRHHYVLEKIDEALFNYRWRLKEVRGKPVSEEKIFFEINKREKRVSGFTGCNNFSGTFQVNKGNRISFSKVITTLKACPTMELESEILKIFALADNFSIANNRLQLNKARMAPLAIFEAAE